MTGRPGREPEGASFEAARVPSRRGSPPIFIIGFFALVGAVVAIGVGGKSGSGPALPHAADASARPTRAADSPTPAATGPSPGGAPVVGSLRHFESGPGPIVINASRLPTSVYVHGDVFVAGVTWLFVSIQDDSGQQAGWASVSVPGAAGSPRETAPSLRFDVEMTVPTAFSGRLWLLANAYDASSSRIASVRLEMSHEVHSRMEFEP